MPEPQGMEYRIVHYALTVGANPERTASWAELRRGIIQETGECRDDEMRQAFVELHARGLITLHKWDEQRARFRELREFAGIYEFFMRGSFRLAATSEGCEWWAATRWQEPARPEHRPIGISA